MIQIAVAGIVRSGRIITPTMPITIPIIKGVIEISIIRL
jgi:hypothetical protein